MTTSLALYLSSSSGLRAGDRLLLVFFPGLHFTICILACFKAGIIAVPVFPPDPRRLQKDLHHFVSIQKDCEAKCALTHSDYNYAKKLTDIQNIFKSKAEVWPDLRYLISGMTFVVVLFLNTFSTPDGSWSMT